MVYIFYSYLMFGVEHIHTAFTSWSCSSPSHSPKATLAITAAGIPSDSPRAEPGATPGTSPPPPLGSMAATCVEEKGPLRPSPRMSP